MGFFDKLANFLKSRKQLEANVVVVGLNNSGKTSIVNHFKSEEARVFGSDSTVPTIGFNVDKFKSQNVGFTAFDMSGNERYRDLWEHYYKDCDGIVFVIDSSDAFRLVVVKEELEMLLQHPEVANKRIPILFFANKMDLRESLSGVKIASALNLDRIMDKPWHICPSNAITGEGLQEGVEWFTQQIRDRITCGKKKNWQ